MTLRKLFSAWTPVGLWMGLIFLFSSQSQLPGLPGTLADAIFKKTGHMAEYAILALLCRRALKEMEQPPHRVFWGAFIIAFLYALSDEWHQTFIPGRNGRPLDVFLDSTGAVLGLSVVHFWQQRKGGAGSARKPTPHVAAPLAGRRDTKVAGE